MVSAARLLAAMGIAFLVAAALLWLLARIGASHVPGTVVVRRGSFTLWAPLGLWVGLSVVLTLVLNLIARLFR